VWDYSSQKAYDAYLKRFREPLSARYQIEGYSAPGMVRNQTDVKRMQEILGNVAVDGIWGPETDAAYWKRRAEEDAMTDTGSALSAASAGRAAEIAQKLRLAAPAKPGGSVSLPAVDNKTSLPYTGGVNTPAAERYQKTILNAPAKPAPSATARTTNAGNPPGIGKPSVRNMPDDLSRIKLSALVPNTYADGSPTGMLSKPVTEKTPKPPEPIPNTYTDSWTPESRITTKESDYSAFSVFDNMDDAVLNASNMLNLTTARLNKEACCNLYSIVLDGETYYFTGEIFVGEIDNVIAPYLSDIQWETLEAKLNGLLDFRSVQYEGFMHSHPYYDYSNKYSGGTGDSLVALLSGNIFLTAPDGAIYNLTEQQVRYGELFTNPGNMSLLQFLTGGLIDPPEVPFHNLQSIDTTPFAKRNWGMKHDVPKAIWQAIQNNIEKVFGPLGYDLYEAAQQFGIDAAELLSQLNLYT